MNVFILTFCRNKELFYGTGLIFKTLRTGFPTAEIQVVDNASLPEVRTDIKNLAESAGCRFQQLTDPDIQHHTFLENVFESIVRDTRKRSEPLIFLDPDLCFWESCENFTFESLIAGRLCSRFFDYITQTVTMPRLHTSFLWITDPFALYREILKIKARRFDFQPFQSTSFFLDGTWYRYDTGASLYSVASQKCEAFNEMHLRCYDHLYGGCHLDWLSPLYNDECRELMSYIHSQAKSGDLSSLKGVWRKQEEVFTRNFPSCGS